MSPSAEENLNLPGEPASAAGSEQRAASRYTPLIRTAKICCATGEFLCVVSDVSSTGVSLRLFHPLPAETALELEMPNGERLAVEPVWQRGSRAGFRFAGEVDLNRLLQGHGKWPKRPIRLNVEMPATLAGLTGRYDVLIRNISLQGAQIECEGRLAIDQRLRLSSDHLPEIVAKVRWRDGKLYGLIFDNTFQFAELAHLAASVQGVASGDFTG